MVKLLGESSIGSGVRRVEALVGLDAFRYLAREHVLVSQLAGEFKAPPEELPERIGGVLERLKDAERELGKLRAAAVLSSAGSLAASAEQLGAMQFVAAEAPPGVGGQRPARAGPRRARPAAARRPGRRAARLAGRRAAERRSWRRSTSPARPPGVKAGELVRAFAPVLGARGGGKADLAQGAGGDAAQAGRRLRRGPRRTWPTA